MTVQRSMMRDGLQLTIHDDGGPGRPILFQHGLCGDARQTFEACPALPGFRRITLECRGHGSSAISDSYAIAVFADDVIALIETLDKPVILGGISMGAALASHIAALWPEHVQAIVLVRPAWIALSAPANMEPNAEVGRLLSTLPASQARLAFEGSETAALLSREAPDNLASLLGFFSRSPQESTARLLVNISADGPGITEADLEAISCPALICGTLEDFIHPFAHAERLHSLLPVSRLVELPPKGRDKPGHFSALHAAIHAFTKDI